MHLSGVITIRGRPTVEKEKVPDLSTKWDGREGEIPLRVNSSHKIICPIRCDLPFILNFKIVFTRNYFLPYESQVFK